MFLAKMFKLPLDVTYESLKKELLQIPHADLLGMAVALALVGIAAAYLYYNKKPKGMSLHLLAMQKKLASSHVCLYI
jgi:hypothetical protein